MMVSYYTKQDTLCDITFEFNTKNLGFTKGQARSNRAKIFFNLYTLEYIGFIQTPYILKFLENTWLN